jgi:predicted DNA-binding transcriptional regulator YafY
MTKSTNTERAQRLNAAIALLEMYESPSEAAVALAAQFQMSKRQAFRYVKEADGVGHLIPIPDQKIVFTVKLSRDLIQALRQHSQSKGQTISETVTQALEALLFKGRNRGQAAKGSAGNQTGI